MRLTNKKRKKRVEKNKEAAEAIYARAMPGRQECPPLIHRPSERPATTPHPSLARLTSTVAATYKANMQGRSEFKMSGERVYAFERNGMVRVLNKPRSRVKRMREERSKA